MKHGIIALALFAGFASGASAKNRWLVDVTYSNGMGYLDANSTATVQIWATFDDSFYALAGGAWDVFTDEAPGFWTDVHSILDGPGAADGVPTGPNVNGIVASQLQDPLAGIFVDTSNPILVWQGTFATAGPFDAHVATLSTSTSAYDCYLDVDANGDGFADGTSESHLHGHVEGHAFIAVGLLPAPGAAAVLTLGILAASRRRR